MIFAVRLSSELKQAIAPLRQVLLPVLVIGSVYNVLLLSGSFFMLLVYDDVIPSRSIPSLVGLLVSARSLQVGDQGPARSEAGDAGTPDVAVQSRHQLDERALRPPRIQLGDAEGDRERRAVRIAADVRRRRHSAQS